MLRTSRRRWKWQKDGKKVRNRRLAICTLRPKLSGLSQAAKNGKACSTHNSGHKWVKYFGQET